MASISLDFRGGQIVDPLEPDIDDLGRANVIKAKRRNGGEATASLDAGLLGTATIGRNPKDVNINPQSDDDLPLHASHHLVLATELGPRYPTITVDLSANPALAASVVALDVGDRISLGSIPPELGRPASDTLALGYVEIIGSHSRVFHFNSARGGILSHVGQLDGGACLQTSGAQLGAAIGDTQTSFLVATTTAGRLFTTSPPASAKIIVRDREVMPVTGLASAALDTFNRTAVPSGNWGTSTSGHAWVIGAGASANFSTSGTQGQISMPTVNVENHIAIAIGHARYQRIRVSSTLGVTPTGAGINWGAMLRREDASNLYWIDVQVGTDSSLTLRVISKIAGANTQLTTAVSRTVHSTSVARMLMTDITDDDVIRAKVWAAGSSEPDWELTYQASHTDLQTGQSVGCIGRLMTGNTNATPVSLLFDDFEVLNPQRFTVTRDPDQRMAHPDAGGVSVYRAIRSIL